MNASNNAFADNTLLNIPTLRDLFTDQAFSDVIECENSETVRTPVVAGSHPTSEEPIEDDRVDAFFKSLGLTSHPFTQNAEENPAYVNMDDVFFCQSDLAVDSPPSTFLPTETGPSEFSWEIHSSSEPLGGLRLSPMGDITDVPDPCDAIINPSLLVPGINMDPGACSLTLTSTDATAVDETYSQTEEGTITPNPLKDDSSTPVTESDSPQSTMQAKHDLQRRMSFSPNDDIEMSLPPQGGTTAMERNQASSECMGDKSSLKMSPASQHSGPNLQALSQVILKTRFSDSRNLMPQKAALDKFLLGTTPSLEVTDAERRSLNQATPFSDKSENQAYYLPKGLPRLDFIYYQGEEITRVEKDDKVKTVTTMTASIRKRDIFLPILL